MGKMKKKMVTKYTKKPWKYKVIDTKEEKVVLANVTLKEAYEYLRQQDSKVNLRTVPMDHSTERVCRERKAR